MFGMNSIVGKSFFKDAGSDKLMVTSRFYTLQGEGPFRGFPAYFVRLSKCNLACAFCFSENTRITMASGPQKKISEIGIGDEVISYDEKTKTFKKGKVTKLYQSQTDSLLCIRTKTKGCNSSDKVYCTAEHPFLVKNKGWIAAKDLAPGDILLHLPSSELMKLKNPMFNSDTKEQVSKWHNKIENKKIASDRRVQYIKDHPECIDALRLRMLENNPMKDPAVAMKGFLSREFGGRKTTAEKRFEIACDGLPIEFVGNGELIVNHKNPDFVVTNQKKLIEVWSESALHAKDRNDDWKAKRSEIFAKAGYEVLFVSMPDSGVKNGLYNQIRETVSEFINNGEEIVSIQKLEKGSGKGPAGKAWTRLAGSKDNSCTVYNFEVDEYHTYIANGKIVHNCDTFFDSGEYLTFDEILTQAQEVIKTFYTSRGMEIPHWAQGKNMRIVLVITGGEPTIQPNLKAFLEQANEYFFHSQIESNGIQFADLDLKTTYVVSPKCLEKDGKAVKYLQPNRQVLERADCLKFVMSSDSDSPYSEVPEWAHKWCKDTGKQVFVSPMNIYRKEPQRAKELRSRLQESEISIEQRSDVDEVISFWEPDLLDMELNQRNHEFTAEYAMKYGFILNLQIHLFASLP